MLMDFPTVKEEWCLFKNFYIFKRNEENQFGHEI